MTERYRIERVSGEWSDDDAAVYGDVMRQPPNLQADHFILLCRGDLEERLARLSATGVWVAGVASGAKSFSALVDATLGDGSLRFAVPFAARQAFGDGELSPPVVRKLSKSGRGDGSQAAVRLYTHLKAAWRGDAVRLSSTEAAGLLGKPTYQPSDLMRWAINPAIKSIGEADPDFAVSCEMVRSPTGKGSPALGFTFRVGKGLSGSITHPDLSPDTVLRIAAGTGLTGEEIPPMWRKLLEDARLRSRQGSKRAKSILELVAWDPDGAAVKAFMEL